MRRRSAVSSSARFVLPDSRDVLSVAPQQTVADAVDRAQAILGVAVALACSSCSCAVCASCAGPHDARRRRCWLPPRLAVPALVLWLVWVSATGESAATLETIGRGVALLVPLGVVAGIVWSRLRRSEASDLVVELRTEGATSLRERLARVLGDPTLEVAYRLDDGRYVDAAGRPLELPQGPDRAITLVTARGEEVAALVHDPALLDEPALVESVRATAGLVLENERLAAEVRAQLAEVRASRARIVAATDAERRRIERNLHDGAQQRLVTLSLTLGLAASRGDAADSDVLSRAQDEVEEAIAELRELARGIHPTLLREEGLEDGGRGARAEDAAAGHGGRIGRGSAARRRRARRLLPRLGSPDERRQARLGLGGHGAPRAHERDASGGRRGRRGRRRSRRGRFGPGGPPRPAGGAGREARRRERAAAAARRISAEIPCGS